MSVSFQELEALMERNGTEERIRQYVTAVCVIP